MAMTRTLSKGFAWAVVFFAVMSEISARFLEDTSMDTVKKYFFTLEVDNGFLS